jgi:hypothetical protein
MRNFVRLLLFVILFSIGAVALAVAALYPDLMRYYRYNRLLQSARESVAQLKSLTAQYDALLKNIENDPNILSRAAPAVIGAEPVDSNAVYPRATTQELAAAREALEKHSNDAFVERPLPEYLQRLGRPRYRIVMFICGCGLVLVAFICFGPTANTGPETISNPRTPEDRAG